jgi:flagellin
MLTPNFISRRSQFELGKTNNAISKSFERLSTGLRINSAADDSAGLSITTRMTSQVEGLNQSIRNANDSISMFQTAEGALNEVTSMLQRTRELAVQAANDVLTTADRDAIQAEITQLRSEIDHISDTTSFNSIKLFKGDAVNRTFQIGANAGETSDVSIKKVDSRSLGRQARYTSRGGVNTTQNLDSNNKFLISLKDGSGFIQVPDSLDASDTLSKYSSKHNGIIEGISAISKAEAINSISEFTGVRATVGPTRTDDQAAANESFIADGFGQALLGNTNSIQATELTANTYMEINGAKIAGFSVENNDATGELKKQINSKYDETGVLAEINGNGELVLIAEDGRDISIAYHSADTDGDPFEVDLANDIGLLSGFDGAVSYGGLITLQSDETYEVETDTVDSNKALGGLLDHDLNATGQFVKGTNRNNSIEAVDVSSHQSSTIAIEIIDLAIEQVSAMRSELGALQNRTESTISNLSQTAENLSAASSRIRDADFASETAHLASNQIKQNAAASMLAQVSQSGQIALSLLQ